MIVIVTIAFSFSSPYFLTLSNASDLIEAYSVTTILAAGVFVVLVSGGIDISFAAVASVTQYIAAMVATRYGVPALPAIALACVLGALLGSVNALLTYYLNVVSIIVTIATSSIFYALLIYFTGGSEIYNLPDWWTDRVVFFRFETATGDFARITLPMVIMVAVIVVTHLLMTRTHAGRQIYALGGNPEAANRVGIRILRLQLLVYGYLGFLAGLAGFVQAHRVHQVVPTAMFGTELSVLAVAILGGASLVGGLGSMSGVVLGVLLLAILQNGLNLLGVSPYFFDVVIGLAILISISVTALTERRAHSRRHIVGTAHEPLRLAIAAAHRRSRRCRSIVWSRRFAESAGTNLVGLLLLLLGLFAAFSVLLPGTFLQPGHMQSMMFQLPELGLLSLAMAIPLVSGGLNLAIIATANQAALLMAWILTTQMPPEAAGSEIWLWIAIALVAGFLLCLVIGLITGFIVAVVGVHPILVRSALKR